MVVAGGIPQALMLPLIGLALIHLRHPRIPREIQPTASTTAFLWVSTSVMVAFASYYAWTRIPES